MKLPVARCGLTIFVVLFCQFTYTVAPDSDEYLRITAQEKVLLDRFRNLMRPYLYTPYMREDIYLIRWLRVKNFNLGQAQQMLLNHLKWRKENQMDSISKVYWGDMKDEYPSDIDGYDRKGRPVATVNIGLWNVRRAVLTGQMPRLKRYILRLFELGKDKVIEMQYQGKNVTQLKVLMNLDGFNPVQHGCPLCIQLYTTFVIAAQNHYTGYSEKIVLINTPVTFRAVLDVIEPIFSPRARQILKVFGPDRKEWGQYLDREISRDQLRPEFGGTKAD